jgi:hypothetical protein
VAEVELTEWQLAGLVLGSIIFVRLLLAPYWIWKEDGDKILAEKKRADELQARLDDRELRARQKAKKQTALHEIAGQICWAVSHLVNPKPSPSRGLQVEF